MNIQHSSRTDVWLTPVWLVEKIKKVLGNIDLDPASCSLANERIHASLYFAEKGLENEWPPGTIYLNPPGGKTKNKSNVGLWWKKFIEHRPQMTHGIFMGFSLECLQNTQNKGVPSVCDFLMCVPKQRVRFDDHMGNPGKAPSHSSVIVYVPGILDRSDLFVEEFKDIGAILNHRLLGQKKAENKS